MIGRESNNIAVLEGASKHPGARYNETGTSRFGCCTYIFHIQSPKVSSVPSKLVQYLLKTKECNEEGRLRIHIKISCHDFQLSAGVSIE